MKRIAILLLCGAFGQVHSASLGERLEHAVRLSDVPRVSYLLKRLSRESLTSSAKKDMMSHLLSLSQRVVHEEKKGTSLGSHDGRAGKLLVGSMCSLAGLYLSLYGIQDLSWLTKDSKSISEIVRLEKAGKNSKAKSYMNWLAQGNKGMLDIYKRWKAGNDQEVENFYSALGGSIISLTGLCLIYDSLRNGGQTSRVSDAKEVRQIFDAQIEELGS